MKTRNYLFKSILLLIAVFCTSATALGQRVSSPAKFTEDGAQEVKLKARTMVPMAPQPGDVNCDAQVSIADVSDLIDLLLKGTGEFIIYADVNLDGMVNIADLSDLIDMLLSGSSVFNSTKALDDLNEIYKSMRSAYWSTTGNYHQCFGISAYNLMAEVMGDDMIMGSMGSGWFWFDAVYNVKNRYTLTTWRSYDLWTAYYTWIANANYLLAASQDMSGTSAEVRYIQGQAYAIRAYSYFMLAQSFARTYKGHESDPCVPLFTGVAFNGSTGAPRSTVAQVFNQINADINQAVSLLNGTTQLVPDHIGYAVALGLKARIALVQEEWETAFNAATDAITASGKRILAVSDFMGVNDANAGNVMWGADIPTEEVGMYASFFTHMSADMPYGQRAPKKISKWLYNKMSNTDERRNWWYIDDWDYYHADYVQKKFEFSDELNWLGDYIYMRIEEMYLTAAEAACRQGKSSVAQVYLNNLMLKRDSNYDCNKTGTALGALTTDETGSLLEEILIQRRIELWGEDGRIYTIRRLRQGFERKTEDGWPTSLVLQSRSLQDPESYPWVLTIPQSEFYNYYSRLIEEVDQNPINDYQEGTVDDIERNPQHISFVEESMSFFKPATQDLDVTVNMTRPVATVKPYYALLCLNEVGSNNSQKWFYVYFAPHSLNAAVAIPFNDVLLGRHSYTLSLVDTEMSVANSSQLTSTRIDINCQNLDSEGQNISFTAAEQNIKTRYNGVDVRIRLTRAKTDYGYIAKVILSEVSDENNILMNSPYITFNAGESTAEAVVRVYCQNYDEESHPQSFVLTLSNEDIATADPNIGGQITSTHVTVELGEPENQNISFRNSSNEWGTESSDYTAYVPLSRIVTNNNYVAHVQISNNSSHVSLRTDEIVFDEGSGDAYAVVDFKNMEEGETQSCVLTLSDADIATADPVEQQITSTTVTVTRYKWISAGTCTITDYTWGDGEGNPVTAENVPIEQNVSNTNMYRIVSPLYYLYNGIVPDPDTSHFPFNLRSDGLVTVSDGVYMNYWGYQAYFNAVNYSGYCFVANDGNTHDVNFLLLAGTSLYTGGRFVFTWNR